MELKTTFSHCYPQGSLGPGTGIYQGECVEFLHHLLDFVTPFGSLWADKVKSVNKYGIKVADLNGHYQIGDIVVTHDEPTYGHVYVVNDIIGTRLQATESNYRFPKRIDHTRLVAIDSKIYGVLRQCPLKVKIINPIPMHLTLVANNVTYPKIPSDLLTVADMMKLYSRNRLTLESDLKTSTFTNVPFVTTDYPGTTNPQLSWYDQNIAPLVTGQVGMFVMGMEDWHGSSAGQTYGNVPHKPCRISLAIDVNLFPFQVFHELCHAILFFTGQKDYYQLNGENRWVVHDYLFKDPPDYYGLLDTVDYQKLLMVLNGINTQGANMNQTKVVLSKDGKTVWRCTPTPDIGIEGLKKIAAVEGYEIPSVIPPSSSL